MIISIYFSTRKNFKKKEHAGWVLNFLVSLWLVTRHVPTSFNIFFNMSFAIFGLALPWVSVMT